jgi:hypothetical protein
MFGFKRRKQEREARQRAEREATLTRLRAVAHASAQRHAIQDERRATVSDLVVAQQASSLFEDTYQAPAFVDSYSGGGGSSGGGGASSSYDSCSSSSSTSYDSSSSSGGGCD